MNKRILEERLEALRDKLNTMTIQQENINEYVLHTRQEVATVTMEIRNKKRDKTKTDTTRKKVSAVAGSGYHIRDYVLIINPSAKQEKQGEIIRETKEGILKIRTPRGKIIRRLPKNMWIVHELYK